MDETGLETTLGEVGGSGESNADFEDQLDKQMDDLNEEDDAVLASAVQGQSWEDMMKEAVAKAEAAAAAAKAAWLVAIGSPRGRPWVPRGLTENNTPDANHLAQKNQKQLKRLNKSKPGLVEKRGFPTMTLFS